MVVQAASQASCRELESIRAAFQKLLSQWHLTQGEVRALLAVADDNVILPAELRGTCAERAKMAIDISHCLAGLLPRTLEIRCRLRTRTPLLQGQSPLQVMSAELERFAGARDLLELCGSVGEHAAQSNA